MQSQPDFRYNETMSTKKVGNIRILFDRKESHTADLIADCCEATLELAAGQWGLPAPEDCRIYVMTSWLGFIFNSAPAKWKLSLIPTWPLWMPRIRRTWPYSAAWTQRYGSRIAIGIKPPRLLEKSDKRIGSLMFIEETDLETKIRNVTCHELIHACSAHLVVPMWLNEGIALYGAEQHAGTPMIRSETLALLKEYVPKAEPPSYRRLSRMRIDRIAYHDCRGYWIVRYLEENYPGLVKSLLTHHRYESEIEKMISEELGLEQADFWLKIDDILTGHFLDTAEE